jgi:hypothetical protein
VRVPGKEKGGAWEIACARITSSAGGGGKHDERFRKFIPRLYPKMRTKRIVFSTDRPRIL